jgi:hypothetical protein
MKFAHLFLAIAVLAGAIFIAAAAPAHAQFTVATSDGVLVLR